MADIHTSKRFKLEQNIEKSSEAGYQEGINAFDDNEEFEMPILQRLDSLEPRNVEVNHSVEDDEAEMPYLRVFDADQNEELIEIPTLVVEIFIEWLKDVKLLKTCRLVNKYWNRLACSSLQIYSIARLDEENKRLEEFLEFLKPKSSRELSLHPSPFKNVHIRTDERDEYFDDYCKLVRNGNIKITNSEISFVRIDHPNLDRLNQILNAAMKELIQLTLRLIRCILIDQVFHDVKFAALKSLSIIQCDHVGRSYDCFEPIRRSFEHCTLEHLNWGVNSGYAPCASSVININLSRLSELTFSGLVELTLLEVKKTEETFWNLLPKLQLPLLKSFSLNSTARCTRPDVENRHWEINAFLLNVASTLTKLDICFGKPHRKSRLRFRETVFPKLKYLFLTFPKDICACLTPARFPSLQTLHLYVSDIKQIQMKDGFEPLRTVRILDIFCYIRSGNDEPDSEEDEVVPVLPFSMLRLARKFPNLENFGASFHCREHLIPLLDRQEAYPNLKCLRHPNSNNFAPPLGTSKEEVEEYERAGWHIRCIAHNPVCFHFKNFECANCK